MRLLRKDKDALQRLEQTVQGAVGDDSLRHFDLEATDRVQLP